MNSAADPEHAADKAPSDPELAPPDPEHTPADSALVRAAQAGDRSAMEQLLERHHQKIYGICRRMLRHEEDASDAAQEVFVSIVRNLEGFSGQAAFSTWAYRIAVNVCKDEFARRKSRAVVSSDVLDAGTDGGTGGGGVAVGAGTGADSSAGEVAETVVEVQTALAQMSEQYRAALVLREQAGLSYEQISELLEVPVGTVRSRIARGRAELAKLLGLDGGRRGHEDRRGHGDRRGRENSTKPESASNDGPEN